MVRDARRAGYDPPMGLLQQPLERRLSAMLGAAVTFEKLHVNVLGGSVEAEGITVAAGDGASSPLLTVRRAKAEVSLRAALKKEIVIRSLTIERPVATVIRHADGRLSLPARLQRATASTADAMVDASVTGRQTSDARLTPDVSEGAWTFEAQKILLVGGEVHFHDATSGYRASLEQIIGEVKEAEGGLEFTLIVDSAGRRDQPANLGQIRMHGRAEDVPDLSRWHRARVAGTLEIGDALRTRITAPSLQPLHATAELSGTFDLSSLPPVLPTAMTGLLPPSGISGKVEVNARGVYDAAGGLCVPELTLRAVDLGLGAGRLYREHPD